MARGAGRVAELLIARSGAAALARRLRRADVVILAYHNVVPHGEPVRGDASLHLEQRAFAEQLDRLLDTHRVVALSELTPGAGPPDDPPNAVLTFDDAYAGALTAGVEELEARGLPATFFVCPGMLGREGFWWDLLAGAEGLADEVREHALWRLAGRGDDVVTWGRGQGMAVTSLPEHARPAGEALLREAAARPGIRLGSHTWSHPNLAALSREDAAAELARTRAWLEAGPSPAAPWIAYPYGLHSDAVVEEARAHAAGALRVEGGPARLNGRWTGAAHRLPRVNVPRGLSVEGLGLRLAGLR